MRRPNSVNFYPTQVAADDMRSWQFVKKPPTDLKKTRNKTPCNNCIWIFMISKKKALNQLYLKVKTLKNYQELSFPSL